nr:succinate dehydrogenase assembly factor 2 [Alkalilimnicola ehrlichii]
MRFSAPSSYREWKPMSELSRLRWRCRRGTKELDIMFERFLAVGYEGLSTEENHSSNDCWTSRTISCKIGS